MDKLKPCPFCGGRAKILVCDDEGNLHFEAGYEENPWSGLGFRIAHAYEENENCPIADYSTDGATLGVHIYDTRSDAIAAWNRRANDGA